MIKKFIFIVNCTFLLVACNSNKDERLSEYDIIAERLASSGCSNSNTAHKANITHKVKGEVNGAQGSLLVINHVYNCGGNLPRYEIVVINDNKVIASLKLDTSTFGHIDKLRIVRGVIEVAHTSYKTDDPRCCPTVQTISKFTILNSKLVVAVDVAPAKVDTWEDPTKKLDAEYRNKFDREAKEREGLIKNTAELYYIEGEKNKHPIRAYCYYLIASSRGYEKANEKITEIESNVPEEWLQKTRRTCQACFERAGSSGSPDGYCKLTSDYKLGAELTLAEYIAIDPTRIFKYKNLDTPRDQEIFETTNDFKIYEFKYDQNDGNHALYKFNNWIGKVEFTGNIKQNQNIHIFTNHSSVSGKNATESILNLKKNDIVKISGELKMHGGNSIDRIFTSIEVVGYDTSEEDFIKNGYK